MTFKAGDALRHIAVIMDGNRRWAKRQGKMVLAGHKAGAKAAQQLVENCYNSGIKYLTLYAFSTENWERPAAEVKALLQIFQKYLESDAKQLRERGVRVRFIGDLQRFPSKLQRLMDEVSASTAQNDKFHLVLALSYSGQHDICNAVKSIAVNLQQNSLNINDVTTDMVADNLMTSDLPAPDLLIRTSGEHRISNFLLWQLAYTELYFCDTLWPDFGMKDLQAAVDEYQSRERRYGT